MAVRAVPVGEISEPVLQRALCHHAKALHSHQRLTQASKVQWNLQAPSAQIRMVAKATLVPSLVMVLLRKRAPKWKSRKKRAGVERMRKEEEEEQKKRKVANNRMKEMS